MKNDNLYLVAYYDENHNILDYAYYIDHDEYFDLVINHQITKPIGYCTWSGISLPASIVLKIVNKEIL